MGIAEKVRPAPDALRTTREFVGVSARVDRSVSDDSSDGTEAPREEEESSEEGDDERAQ